MCKWCELVNELQSMGGQYTYTSGKVAHIWPHSILYILVELSKAFHILHQYLIHLKLIRFPFVIAFN